MQEDIKILEEYLKCIEKSPEEILKSDEIIKFIEWKEIQAIKHLIKAYKDIEADLYSANCIISEQIDIINNSVDKDKIKEIKKNVN